MFIEQYFSGKRESWRYFVGITSIVVAILVGQIPIGVYIAVLKEFNPQKAVEFSNALNNIAESGISSNVLFFFNLIPFLFAFFAMGIVMKYLHERKPISVATSRPKFDWHKFIFAAISWMLLNIILEYIFYLIYPDNYEFSFHLKKYIPLFFITVLLIPFQSAIEELAIRGYLLQMFGGWFKYRWLAILLTALLFASLHLSNPEFEEFGSAVAIYYIAFGIIAALIAVIDGGLEIPIAIHIMNNVYGALFVSFKGSVFSTATLFKVDRIELSTMLTGWFIMLALFVLILQIKYKWKNWATVLQKVKERADI